MYAFQCYIEIICSAIPLVDCFLQPVKETNFFSLHSNGCEACCCAYVSAWAITLSLYLLISLAIFAIKVVKICLRSLCRCVNYVSCCF